PCPACPCLPPVPHGKAGLGLNPSRCPPSILSPSWGSRDIPHPSCHHPGDPEISHIHPVTILGLQRCPPSILSPSWGSRDIPHPSCHRPGDPGMSHIHPVTILWHQGCPTSILSPFWAGPSQAHLHHMWRLLPHCSLQMKMSKPPAPRENPQSLCKAGLAPSGQTHPSQAPQEETPVLPSLSTGVMAQLPLLVATGTGLQLLPSCKSPAWSRFVAGACPCSELV
uniref:Uncharacterized protein n=1 Tax=Cyanistes caeruleus TaxID=156563 RepID=A0A8C0VA26_CYACU